MKALVSIHDVMPETLGRVSDLIGMLPQQCRAELVLLVVPGLDWRPTQVDNLRAWQDGGIVLAGHGWRHRSGPPRGLRHRLHSALLSRNAAEHLALSRDEIAALLQRNFDWFAAQALQAPDYYVPPAWAMGNIDRQGLRQAPFRYYETTAGIYDSENDRLHRLPLAGFEADTHWRRLSLSCWNRCNRMLAGRRRPLRISIHPNDASLLLRKALPRYLAGVSEAVSYRL